MITIQGGNRDVQVVIDGKIMSPGDWVKFTKALKSDFQRCHCEMAGVGQSLEKWSIVANRFAMISDTCAGFHEILTEEADTPDFTPHKRDTEEGIQRYNDQIKNLGQRANRVFSASLSLDLITPVLAEAFINFVIFLTQKKEFKQNPRQYDAYIRQQIDTRIFDLHLKCDHFTRGIDQNSPEYKAFKKVMDRRNYNLYGNIDPKQDAIETVYFDKFTPLYKEPADPILELFRKKEALYDIGGTIGRYHDVHIFFQHVLGAIDKKARMEIEAIMSNGTFGYDLARKKAGLLFSDREVMMLMPLEYDDELDASWS